LPYSVVRGDILSQVTLPDIRDTNNPELKVQYLTDAYVRLKKELSFLLGGNLDEDNVSRITTDQLVAGTAKIGAAMIEDLVVGSNVTMGPEATISWLQVEEKPVDLVYQAALDNYVTNGTLSSALLDYLTIPGLETQLGRDWIITGKIAANNISTGILTGVTINVNTDLTVGNNIYIGQSLADKSVVFNGGTQIVANGYNMKLSASDLYLEANVSIGSPYSNVGFFGSYGYSKQSISLLSDSATLSDVIIKLNGLMTRLGYYGLFSVS
jgi:hypothetical protein